jgi:hypothetical protein
MRTSPPRTQRRDRAGPLGCLCELLGAFGGFLVVAIAAFVYFPWPPPDAPKSHLEAHGVYACFLGLGGFAAGGFGGSLAGKVISRGLSRRSP